MSSRKITDSMAINLMAGVTSASLFAASAAAAWLCGEKGRVLKGLLRIMTSPCPLITDYYQLAGISSAFLNAGICGMICVLLMCLIRGESKPNAFAGFLLVITHCFYGLNPVNMMPCLLAPMIYMKQKKLSINDNLHVCMFATCFGPFISELLYRYTIWDTYVPGRVHVTQLGIILALLFSVVIGYVIPAILPGAHAWHKGFNLFNGGLAFGIFGFFAYNLLYTTFGVPTPLRIEYYNELYDSNARSYTTFVNCYFLLLFSASLLAGLLLNRRSLKGYNKLLHDSGHMSNFVKGFGIPLCLINIGLYGLMFLGYVNFVMMISEGAGFTGPTTGVIFAAMTFALLGQHPENVWPILAGFLILHAANVAIRAVTAVDPGWTVSSQSYINAAAFATGACPIVGRYGRRAGCAAGIIDGVMCRATGALHGGLVLYNGGFTIGITILVLLPILEHYVREQKLRGVMESMDNFIVVEEKKESDQKQ